MAARTVPWCYYHLLLPSPVALICLSPPPSLPPLLPPSLPLFLPPSLPPSPFHPNISLSPPLSLPQSFAALKLRKHGKKSRLMALDGAFLRYVHRNAPAPSPSPGGRRPSPSSPSSRFIATFMALQRCKRVTLYGFHVSIAHGTMPHASSSW